MSVFRLHNPFSVLKKCLMSTFLLSSFLHFKHLECLRGSCIRLLESVRMSVFHVVLMPSMPRADRALPLIVMPTMSRTRH